MDVKIFCNTSQGYFYTVSLCLEPFIFQKVLFLVAFLFDSEGALCARIWGQLKRSNKNAIF